MPSRRLSDHIRELCAKVLVTPESAEFMLAAEQLRAALREHAEHLRKLAASYPRVQQRRQSDAELEEAKLLLRCTICGHPIPLEIAKGNEEGHPVHEGCYVLKLKAIRSNPPMTPNGPAS